MFKRRLSAIALCSFIISLFAIGSMAAEDEKEFEIPFKKYVLKNGLTLIHHQDTKAPIVAVNIWYHVGSKNEKIDKTGFAHLFEHLMFNGSENYNDDYFKVINPLGATNVNGTTNFDRTNYFENVPKSAVDVVLWMESDRMGHLIGALDQEKLDEQRDVVKNEKRQGDNQPYGKILYAILENVFPPGHPYSHSIIGSMEHLDAASLEDVHEWFKTYYGPNNAVISVAGDIDFETAKAKVEKYFGDIPPSPPINKIETWVPVNSGTRRMTMLDRVPLSQFIKVWATPEWGSEESDRLSLVANILSTGKSSRLYKRLVYDDQVALVVQALSMPLEVSGLFGIIAMPKPGVPVQIIEKIVNEELEKLLAEGPTEEELTRVRTQRLAGFVRGAEQIGGFGGKSDILATNMVYGGKPDYYKTTMSHLKEATTANLHEVAKKWLSDGSFILEVHPYPNVSAKGDGVDRSSVPEPGEPPVATYPPFKEATLSNGMKLYIIERDVVPVVQFNLVLDAGYAADQFAAPGTASFTLSMLDEGTATQSALEVSDKMQLLGMTLGSNSNLDQSIVTMSAIKPNLDESMALFADIVINPGFPERNIGRTKQEFMGSIRQEEGQPNAMAMRVMPKLLYGEGHAYSNPLTGSGTMASIMAMKRDDVAKFHSTWFKANHASMVVVGDTTVDEIIPKLEQYFAAMPKGDIPKKNISTVPDRDKSTVYILNRTGAEQSVIFAGKVIQPTKADSEEIAINLMNMALGGDFNARINMNLREDKGWSYGARQIITDAVGQRPYLVIAPVQLDKTKEAMTEIMNELNGVIGDNPVTEEELTRVKKAMTLTLPGSWETGGAIAGSLIEMIRFGYDRSLIDNWVTSVNAIGLDAVNAAAKKVVEPDKIIWVIVGDREKIEEGIKELGIGDIVHLDPQGNVIAQK